MGRVSALSVINLRRNGISTTSTVPIVRLLAPSFVYLAFVATEAKFGVRSEIDIYVSDKDIDVTGQPIQNEIIPILKTQ